MANKSSNNKKIAILSSIVGFTTILISGVLIASIMFSDTISRYLSGIGGSNIYETTLNNGTDLVEDVVEE